MNRSKICYEVFLSAQLTWPHADKFINFFAVEISNVKIGFQSLCREKKLPIFKVKTENWQDIPQRLEGRLF